jgi:hypothetical protein
LSKEEQFEKAFELLKQMGVTDDISNVVCDEYSEEEILQDNEKIDWEKALMEIEAAQEVKRPQEFDKIAEQERQKAQ